MHWLILGNAYALMLGLLPNNPGTSSSLTLEMEVPEGNHTLAVTLPAEVARLNG